MDKTLYCRERPDIGSPKTMFLVGKSSYWAFPNIYYSFPNQNIQKEELMEAYNEIYRLLKNADGV